MKNIALIVFVSVSLVGCKKVSEGPTLEQFANQWEKALNSQGYNQLFEMLDSASQRKIRHNLEVMRGLDVVTHRMILDQLKANDIKDLRKLSAARYFSLLWQRATGNQKGTLNVAGRGTESADMVVTFNSTKRLPLRLLRENSRWVWQLPPQQLDREIVPVPARQ